MQEPQTVKDRAKRKLERDMGEDLLAALYNPKTVEIMLNPDGKLWLEPLGEKMRCIGSIKPAKAQAIIETISGFHGKEVTFKNPLLECELPLDGSRFTGQLAPVVKNPTFTIRKKAIQIFTLDQYVETNVMTSAQKEVLVSAVKNHRNILVIGGTGTGKTTLVNAIINEMVICDPTERVLIVEDTGEIQCAASNYIQYHTTVDVSMTELLKTILRMRPDRLMVGEVRGPEAFNLLMAWNSGHEGGAATLHANNAKAGLDKLAMYISMHPDSPSPIEPLIGEAVHVVVHIAREVCGRRIKEIIEISGYESGRYNIKHL